MNAVMFFYVGNPSLDMLETCLRSLRNVNPTCEISIACEGHIAEVAREYDCKIIPAGNWQGRRMLRRTELAAEWIQEKQDGDQLLVSDVDVLFIKDPFAVFDDHPRPFDLGLTSRFYDFPKPINGGIVYYRKGPASARIYAMFQNFLSKWHGSEDWWVEQDFFCWLWWNRKHVHADVEDVGWQYNFCPGEETFGPILVNQMIRRAYECKAVTTIHMKGAAKFAIYDGYMEEACIKHLDCITVWSMNETKSVEPTKTEAIAQG